MSEKAKPYWLSRETFPKIWIWTCVALNIFGIGAVGMLFIAEIMILANNFTHYIDQYGHRYPSHGYVGEAGCGHVEYTNAPKHLGSAIWMLFFQLSIVVLASLVIASDLAWRKSSYNEWGGHYVEAFYAVGIMPGSHDPNMYYYVIANAFLKLFIVVLYMSQSFYGLPGGSHSYPSHASSYTSPPYPDSTPSTDSSWGSGSSGNSMSSTWRRGGDDLHMTSYGTELWAFWTGWIVLGSIVPSTLAFVFLVPWAAVVNTIVTVDEEKSVSTTRSNKTSTAANARMGGTDEKKKDSRRDRKIPSS